MIWLNPAKVTLGALALEGVTHIAIDREAERLSEEWTDLGPFAAFADVPEQRVRVLIVRRVAQSETAAPRPGDALALSFRTSATASAAGVRSVSVAQLVVTGVEHAVSAGSSGAASATQRIRGVALSTTGSADPVTETIVEGEV
ncbi:MAG: hypothetical protein SFZ24_11880 [Planctomycetota bacterium]|nr:hypothetical protein [Planctomycetota bacterium]